MVQPIRDEIKKISSQKTIGMLGLISILLPTADALLCVSQRLKYHNLLGINILFGNYLIAPCIVMIVLITLFQMEDENDTMKNILLTGEKRWAIAGRKLLTTTVVVILFDLMIWITGLLCGLFLGGVECIGESLAALLVSLLASYAASMPITLAIIIFRKKYLMSMIVANCFVVVDFLLVWQLTMLKGTDLLFPIMVSYKITYPFQIISYSPELQYGLDALYQEPFRGAVYLVAVAFLSILADVLVYKNQAV